MEYDAYRVDLEWAGQQGGDTGLLAEARRQHDLRLAEYQRLREKVTVKLTLLDENRVRRAWFVCRGGRGTQLTQRATLFVVEGALLES